MTKTNEMRYITILFNDDKFKVEVVKSEERRDGSTHYTIKKNQKLADRIIPSHIEVEGDLKIIIGKSFVDDKTYYKLAIRDKFFTFSPEVFFVNEDE